MLVKDQYARNRDVTAMAVLHNGELREVTRIAGMVDGELRLLWAKYVPSEQTGYVFTQGHPIAVSGRFIRLLGQQK